MEFSLTVPLLLLLLLLTTQRSMSSIIDILNQFSECHERDMVVIYVIKEMSKTIQKNKKHNITKIND